MIRRPICPELCCFREICPSTHQRRAARRFRQTRYQVREDCPHFETLRHTLAQDLGVAPPATAAELRTLLGTIRPRDQARA